MDFKIGSDGLPIVWWLYDGNTIHSVHCNALDCSSLSPIITLSLPNTPAWFVTQYISIEIGIDSYPVFLIFFFNILFLFFLRWERVPLLQINMPISTSFIAHLSIVQHILSLK